MTIEYVRKFYGLDIKPGQRVELHMPIGVITGTIIGADHRVWIRWDGHDHELPYHPQDPGLKYLDEQEASDA